MLSLSARRIYIYIIYIATYLAFIFIIYFHYFNLLHPILYEFLLVLLHEVLANTQLSYFLWFFHSDHHAIEDKIGFSFDGFKGFKNVSILLSIYIQRMFWFEPGL
jgi:hypothetical protein